jgi:UDP-N-acetyl-D-galactosamine dehydrogenase
MSFDLKNIRLGIIGLGYVGLPLAVEFGRKYPTVGFDVKTSRVDELKGGSDSTLEVPDDELAEASKLTYTADAGDIADCNFYIVTVPTPIGDGHRPLLTPLKNASNTISKVLKPGDIVVYESTVYPGATEEFCVPILESGSGLTMNEDFFVGYSPERINPGDQEHRLPSILKVTSGSTPEVAQFIDEVYRSIITAGTHKASSIKVAEAAKVIENTQRDVNIALINELAMIFERVGIDTEEVLVAAGTKWNFLPFRPGLVGGHCIGIDPYYLTYKAQQLGYNPEMILAGRRINDNMSIYVASRIIKLMLGKGQRPRDSRILVMGMTFKENCPDVRNTKVVDIVHELVTYRRHL